MTVNDYAKNLLANQSCENCSWKINVCFSSSPEVWCHRMMKEPKEKTCENFSKIPEIITHLKEYVAQKHI